MIDNNIKNNNSNNKRQALYKIEIEIYTHSNREYYIKKQKKKTIIRIRFVACPPVCPPVSVSLAGSYIYIFINNNTTHRAS